MSRIVLCSTLLIVSVASARVAPVERVGDQLRLPEPIEFDIDSSDIRPRSLPLIDRVATWLREHPDVRIEIQAHTDPAWVCEHCGRRLTRDRAYSVLAALVDRGIARERMEARDYEGRRPLTMCNQRRQRARRACQTKNRRIEIHLL